MTQAPPVWQTWQEVTTQQGHRLDDLSRQAPVLVVFLRHAGCPFCKTTLAQLQRQRSEWAASGTRLVLVHMTTDALAARFFAAYGFADAERISDPDRRVYELFQIGRGNWWQIAGPGVWWAGLKALAGGHWPGMPQGDVRQLPGAVLLQNGQIIRRYAARDSADQPDYGEFARCELPPAVSERPPEI